MHGCIYEVLGRPHQGLILGLQFLITFRRLSGMFEVTSPYSLPGKRVSCHAWDRLDSVVQEPYVLVALWRVISTCTTMELWACLMSPMAPMGPYVNFAPGPGLGVEKRRNLT